MTTQEQLAEQFEEQRTHLRSVAYRMLGSVGDADDAVQEAWLRLARSDVSEVANLQAWLTTVVSRVCLDLLRARKSRREDPLESHVPDPVVSRLDADPEADPEAAAERADAVSLALLVVLETLPPRERMAFVLHDMFGVPFGEIGTIVGSSAATATQLASRARRRVRNAPPAMADLPAQRRVLDAFLAAAREGDFDALVAVLDPDVTLRADTGSGGTSGVIRGAAAVAGQALMFAKLGPAGIPVLVNGSVGLVAVVDGRPMSVFSPTISEGRIVEINIVADPDRLAELNLREVI
jgi:RNA polymerase sigma factor (sigma-70 family)